MKRIAFVNITPFRVQIRIRSDVVVFLLVQFLTQLTKCVA
jgi:hypothetical protein